MTKELTTKELLEALHGMYMSAEYFYNRGHGKKAYTQIRKMIEEHIALKGELADVKLTLAGLRIAEGKSPIEQSVTTNQQVEHKQILAIVADVTYALRKDFFPDKTAERIVKSLDKAIKIIKQLLTQQGKPQKQVTREEIEILRDRLIGMDFPLADSIPIIVKWLKELGIVVVKK